MATLRLGLCSALAATLARVAAEECSLPGAPWEEHAATDLSLLQVETEHLHSLGKRQDSGTDVGASAVWLGAHLLEVLAHVVTLGWGLPSHITETLTALCYAPACANAVPDCKPQQLMNTTYTHFYYGNTCGGGYGCPRKNAGVSSYAALAPQSHRCGPGRKPFREAELEGHRCRVCDDNGSDRCCAKHDLGRVTMDVQLPRPLSTFTIMECGVNHDFVRCGQASNQRARRGDDFSDGLFGEAERSKVMTCWFSAAPCLAPSSLHPGKWQVIWPQGQQHRMRQECMGDCYTSDQKETLQLSMADIVAF